MKRQDIELLRIISTFAIVWYHSGAIGHEISYGGLIIFVLLSMYLAGQSNYSGNHPYLRKFERIIIPWSIWFVIYGLVNVLLHKPIIPLHNGIFAGILSGSSIHLWYMPFIFGCLLLFDIVKRHASKSLIAWLSAVLTTTILGSTPFWRLESIQLGEPLAQYAHALAAVTLGIFFSYLSILHGRYQIFLLFIIVISALSAIPYTGVGIPYLIGIFAGSILVYRPLLNKLWIFTGSSFDFSSISQYTLGIYFVHVLILTVLEKTHFFYGIYLPLTGIVLSILTVYLLRRTFPKLAKYTT